MGRKILSRVRSVCEERADGKLTYSQDRQLVTSPRGAGSGICSGGCAPGTRRRPRGGGRVKKLEVAFIGRILRPLWPGASCSLASGILPLRSHSLVQAKPGLQRAACRHSPRPRLQRPREGSLRVQPPVSLSPTAGVARDLYCADPLVARPLFDASWELTGSSACVSRIVCGPGDVHQQRIPTCGLSVLVLCPQEGKPFSLGHC